jgi:hypothetical protein
MIMTRDCVKIFHLLRPVLLLLLLLPPMESHPRRTRGRLSLYVEQEELHFETISIGLFLNIGGLV